MDTPKQVDFVFMNFPPDIWSYVVWYVPGDQLGRLKMTGCKLLWRKLCLPKVVKSVKLGTDFIRYKSWPAFLSEFPTLEGLFVYITNMVWPPSLDSLSPSLKKLQFGHDGPPHLLDETGNFFADPKRTLNLGKHLPNLEELDVLQLHLKNYSWLPHSPQTLTSLRILFWDGSFDLPDSLIHLSLDSIKIYGRTNLKLPPGLETLSVEEGYIDRLDLLIPLLPPSFRKLEWYTRDYMQNMSIQNLPRSMASLCLPTIDFGTYDVHRFTEIVSELPPTLTEFSARCCLPASAWSAFPPNLQKLTFATGVPDLWGHSETPDEVEFHSFPVGALPRSITDLVVFGYPRENWNLHADSNLFPPQLTSLEIVGLRIPSELAKYLPPTLVELTLFEISDKICQNLPNGLKSLTCQSTLMSPNLIKFLPKSLTLLHLSLGQYSIKSLRNSDADPDSEDLEDSEDSEDSEGISDSEYHIHENYGSNIEWKGEYSLPPTLTELKLERFFDLGDSLLLHQRLPNLRELCLSGSKHFTDLSIPLLAPHITILNLSKSAEISGKCFSFLPRGLTSLDLASATSISDSDIRYLPRTLKIAYLDSATDLTDLCVPDLPPLLEKLKISKNNKISSASFPNFPYTLRAATANCFFHSVELATWKIAKGKIEQFSRCVPRYK